MARFEAELRLYEADIDRMAPDAGQWARGLPQTLFWALGFLRLSLPENRGSDDESVLAASFAAARRLVENHRDQARLIINAQLLEDRGALAERIVEEVSRAASPMTFRNIARCFRDQKKERFMRVIEALIKTNVLIRGEGGGHTSGPVDLADVREILNQKFMQP